MRGCNEAQRAGAAQSYLKRYQLQALTGLPTEDNDASSEGFSKAKVDTPKATVAQGSEAPKSGGFGVKKPAAKVEETTEEGWD